LWDALYCENAERLSRFSGDEPDLLSMKDAFVRRMFKA
jgi:hypothetical protein